MRTQVSATQSSCGVRRPQARGQAATSIRGLAQTKRLPTTTRRKQGQFEQCGAASRPTTSVRACEHTTFYTITTTTTTVSSSFRVSSLHHHRCFPVNLNDAEWIVDDGWLFMMYLSHTCTRLQSSMVAMSVRTLSTCMSLAHSLPRHFKVEVPLVKRRHGARCNALGDPTSMDHSRHMRSPLVAMHARIRNHTRSRLSLIHI